MYYTEQYGKVIKQQGEKDPNNHLQYRTEVEAAKAAQEYLTDMVRLAQMQLYEARQALENHEKKYQL